MVQMRDVKPVFEWAKYHGETKIVDRILVRILPELLKNRIELTVEAIDKADSLLVSDQLYDLIRTTANELVGNSCREQKDAF